MIIIISNYSISPISVCASSRHGFLKERVFNLYAMALFHAGIWGLGNLGPDLRPRGIFLASFYYGWCFDSFLLLTMGVRPSSTHHHSLQLINFPPFLV
jgi:hypothetical protein